MNDLSTLSTHGSRAVMTDEQDDRMSTGHPVEDTEDSEVSALDAPWSFPEDVTDEQQLNMLLSRIAAVLDTPTTAASPPGGR